MGKIVDGIHFTTGLELNTVKRNQGKFGCCTRASLLKAFFTCIMGAAEMLHWGVPLPAIVLMVMMCHCGPLESSQARLLFCLRHMLIQFCVFLAAPRYMISANTSVESIVSRLLSAKSGPKRKFCTSLERSIDSDLTEAGYVGACMDILLDDGHHTFDFLSEAGFLPEAEMAFCEGVQATKFFFVSHMPGPLCRQSAAANVEPCISLQFAATVSVCRFLTAGCCTCVRRLSFVF